jgi:hypothetical protein
VDAQSRSMELRFNVLTSGTWPVNAMWHATP